MHERPELAPVGFKEWSSVCAAIGAGRQRIVLRKGGIAEGRTGFSFAKHDAFFLFPTLFHQQEESAREVFELGDVPVEEESIPLRYFVEVRWRGEMRDWEAVQKLEPLHIWKESVIRERFDYGDEPGKGSVQLAVLRVWELAETWRIPYHRSYGGCRSWVDLPEIPQQITAADLRLIDAPGSDDQVTDLLASLLASVLANSGVNVSV
ncbi:MAG: DUF1802 family protein [Verrucomicrobia bacterium]|nr:DUF1802 family protein [Verrucomicrobiota bacterium]